MLTGLMGVHVPEGAETAKILRPFADSAPELHWVRQVAALGDVPLSGGGRVIVDRALDGASKRVARDCWARLLALCEVGFGVVVCTTMVEHAYRCDNVELAGWTLSLLTLELSRIQARFEVLTPMLFDDSKRPPPSVYRELQLLTRASHALLREARSKALSGEHELMVHEASAGLATVMLDERLLERLLASFDR